MYKLKYLDNYLIQPDGKIFNLKRNRYQYQQTCKLGYKRVWLTDKFGRRNTHLVHRLVASIYIKNKKGKPDVNHKDGIKNNNFYTNLEWVTKSENQKHAYKKGLNKSRKGVKNKRK